MRVQTGIYQTNTCSRPLRKQCFSTCSLRKPAVVSGFLDSIRFSWAPLVKVMGKRMVSMSNGRKIFRGKANTTDTARK